MMTQVAFIPDLPPDDPSFGPAMRLLNPMQRKFVLATQIIGPGKGNYAECARLAGYSLHANSATVIGSRLARDPKIQTAILEEAGKRLGARADWVMMQVIDIAENTGDQRLRLKALLELANRCGLHATTEQRISVTHEVGPQAVMLTKIKEMVRKNPGLSAMVPGPIQKLLSPPVDAEFTVLDKSPVTADTVIDPTEAEILEWRNGGQGRDGEAGERLDDTGTGEAVPDVPRSDAGV